MTHDVRLRPQATSRLVDWQPGHGAAASPAFHGHRLARMSGLAAVGLSVAFAVVGCGPSAGTPSPETSNSATPQLSASAGLSASAALSPTPAVTATPVITAVPSITPTPLAFVPAGSMHAARSGHIAILMDNGLVLIAGGNAPSKNGPAIASAELYNPENGTFTVTGSMKVARRGHAAVQLPNHKILITGGTDATGHALASAELYDEDTGTFTLTSSMHAARTGHTAVGVAQNSWLIAGGWNGTIAVASAELYNWVTGVFTLTGSMKQSRYNHTATLIDPVKGRVLIAGGEGATNAVSEAEIYDQTTGQFTVTGSMHESRANHTATWLFGSKKVLIAGGGHAVNTGAIGWGQVATAELYDVATGTFSLTGSMKQARENHTANILGYGDRVLIVGGHDWDPNGAMDSRSYLASAELYDPATAKFTPAGTLKQGRDGHTATWLGNNHLIVMGGGTFAVVSGSPGTPSLASAEMWND